MSLSNVGQTTEPNDRLSKRKELGKFKQSSMDCDLKLLAGKFTKNGKLSISKMKIDFTTGKIGLKFGP